METITSHAGALYGRQKPVTTAFTSPYNNDARPTHDAPLRDGVPTWADVSCRADPYYDWEWPLRGAFVFEHIESPKMIAARKRRPMSTTRARVCVKENLHAVASIMSVLGSYRTVVKDQLAVLTGLAPHILTDLIDALFALGVIERGLHVYSAIDDVRVEAYCLSRKTNAINEIVSLMPLPLRWATKAGHVLKRGIQHDKHNILASEILARAATYIPHVLVAGEAHANVVTVTGEQHARQSKRGDGMIVTGDGRVICLELQATIHRLEADKVCSWVDKFHHHPGNSSVIFVDATDIATSPTETTCAQLRARIEKFYRTYYSASYYEKALARIYVASWREWFAPHRVGAEFAELQAWCFRAGTWVREALIEPSAPPTPTPIRRGLSSTLLTPEWTREDRYPLWATLVPQTPTIPAPSLVRLPPLLDPGQPSRRQYYRAKNNAR